MKNNSQIKTKTKQDLIEAFWLLYSEKRIDKITVKEITTKAGYNRSTFYEYFSDVYDLLEQIESSLIPSINELPPTSILGNNIGLPLDSFLKLFEQNEKYYSVLLGDNGDPAFTSNLKDSLKPILRSALVIDINLDDIELDFVLEYMLSSMISIMAYYFKKDKELPAPKLINLMNNIMENGIKTIFN